MAIRQVLVPLKGSGGSGGSGAVPGKILFDVRRPQLDDYGHLAIDGIAVEDNEGLDNLQHIEFLAPSIDESDPGLWGEGSIDATSDPAVFTPTAVNSGSRLGRDFAPGTLIQWDDPQTVVIGGDSRYSSEINQLTDIDPVTGGWTLRRHIEGDTYGTAMYGSDMVGHSAKRFYPLILPANFSIPVGIDRYSQERPWTPSGLSRPVRWSHRSMSVAAVASIGKGPGGYGPIHIVNLADPDQTPKSPGLRTHSGAAYTNLGRDGVLSVGQRERFPVSVANWHAIRCVFGKVGTAPIGTGGTFAGVLGDVLDACLVVYVLYFAPADSGDEASRVVAIVEQLGIGDGKYMSYAFDDQPDGRQMPYGMTWPTKALPVVGTLGTLALPLSLTGPTLIERPDGQYGFLIASVGANVSGRDLIVTVQK